MHHTQNLKMETGIETTYKVGDKVIATTPYMGEKKDRDGIIRDVQPNKYAAGFTHRVEVVVAGDTTYYWLTADKLRLAQTPASKTIKELAAEHLLASDMSLHKTMEDADAENERVALLEAKAARLDQLESKEVEPPADPPKPERIRRSNEERALGIPLDQILAYRADPEGWLKSEHEATEAFKEVIEQAKESHWEDKVDEIRAPEETADYYSCATPEQAAILEGLGIGWSESGDGYSLFTNFMGTSFEFSRTDVKAISSKGGVKFDGVWDKSIPFADWAKGVVLNLSDKPADEAGGEYSFQTLLRLGWERDEEAERHHSYEKDGLCITFLEDHVVGSREGFKERVTWSEDMSFEAWVNYLVAYGFKEPVVVLFKPAADVSVLETTEPDWDKCMKAVRDDMEQFGPKPDVKFIQTTKVNGERFYVTVEPDSPMPQFYPSATNIVGTTMRMDEEILKWMVDKFPSYDAYKEELSMLAAKGSVMHGLFADAINAAVSKLGLPKYTEYEKWNSYFNVAWARQGYPHLAARWHKWMLKALQSFMKWVLEYEVIFVAVEIPMRSKRMKVAGQIDVICTMLESPRKTSRSDEERDLGKRTKTAMESGKKKGLEGDALAAHVMNAASKPYKPREPKRILALVDFKSGGAKESHYPQMAVYLQMVRENYPSLVQKLHHVFVWAPIKTGWKKEPTYSFKDVSKLVGIYMERQLPQMIHLARERAVDMDKETVLVMEGSPELGMAPEYRHIPLAEYWMERIQAGDFGERDLEISENPDEEQEDDEDGNE